MPTIIKTPSSESSLPTKQRIIVIIQLCIAFSLILWYAFQPFMGEYFNIKSRMLLYEYVMGTSTLLKSDQQKDVLGRNEKRLTLMNNNDKRQIERHYKDLYLYSTRPLLTKIGDGLKTLLLDIPSFKLAWIIFASLISIFLLIKRDGSEVASWLLPCIALVYGIDNQLNGHPPHVPLDSTLFPTESVIIEEYLKESLAHGVEEQRAQLKNGWNTYLVFNWSTDPTQSWNERIEEAEFNFTLARINRLRDTPIQSLNKTYHERSHFFWISIYFLWNVFFAWSMTDKTRFSLGNHVKHPYQYF